MRKILPGSLILSALLSVGLSTPNALEAQQPQPATTVSAAELTSYAKAFVEIGRLRDDLQVQLTQPVNKTPDAQAEIREQMRERRLQIIQSHNLTEEAYTRITFVVSTDDAQREAFREAVEQVSER
ncbi:MAG: DUF4168 domain-containing protein [Gemmatimonas sp.]|nr:DUF4168 domain-containing protein [Gemmatimonas sp.]